MSDAKVTITFDPELLANPLDFIKKATVEVGNKPDGSPALSSGQLLMLLIRILSVLTILANDSKADAYYAASQYSSLVADDIRKALNKEFDIAIVLESLPDQRN